MANPEGELLLAVVGVARVIEPGALRITVDMREKAARLPNAIRRELRRFLTSAEFDEEKPLPEFDYQRIRDLLAEELTVDAMADNLRGLEGEEAIAFAAAATNARAYLANILPKRARITATGPKAADPSDSAVSRFARAYGTLNDPMVVLEDLNEGALSADQVATLSDTFPELYSEIKAALFQVLSDLVAARPKYEVPHEKEKMLEVLLQTRTFNKGLAKAMQDAFASGANPEAAGQPRGGKAPNIADGAQTVTQRIESR